VIDYNGSYAVSDHFMSWLFPMSWGNRSMSHTAWAVEDRGVNCAGSRDFSDMMGHRH